MAQIPPEVLQLRETYQKAQIKLISIISSQESRGNVTTYRKAILAQTNAELKILDDFAVKWSKDNVTKAYTQSVEDVYTAYRAAHISVPVIAANQRVIKLLSENASGQLLDAHRYIGRMIDDQIRQSGIEAVADKVSTGSTVKETKKILIQKLTDKGIMAIKDKAGRNIKLEVYAETVARTTTREATNKGTMQQLQDMGEDLVQMTNHSSSCLLCASYEGRVYSISGKSTEYPSLDVPFSGDYANIHPNCFVSGTPILASGVIAHSSRDYIGEVVTIKITGGDEFTITPNHPILTPKGWVNAGLLLKGDEVVKYINTKDFLDGKSPNDINVPTVIEDIPHALGDSLSVVTVSVKTTSEDFHGDGTNGEIAVINTYSFLRSKGIVGIIKKLAKISFIKRPDDRSVLNAFCSFTQIFKRACTSPNSIVCRLGLRLSFFWGHSSRSYPSRFRGVECRYDSYLLKPFLNSHISNTEVDSDSMFINPVVIHKKDFIEREIHDITSWFSNDNRSKIGEVQTSKPNVFFKESLANANSGCDLLHSLSGKVEFLRIVDVKSKFFHGKVFNLQTQNEWYLANNIITHNCGHSLSPYIKSFDDNASDTKTFSNRSFDVNPQSKAQIDSYNKGQKIKADRRNDRNEYEEAKLLVPDQVPKTFSGFRAMKKANNDNYKTLTGQIEKVVKPVVKAPEKLPPVKTIKPIIPKLSEIKPVNIASLNREKLLDHYTDRYVTLMKSQGASFIDSPRSFLAGKFEKKPKDAIIAEVKRIDRKLARIEKKKPK